MRKMRPLRGPYGMPAPGVQSTAIVPSQVFDSIAAQGGHDQPSPCVENAALPFKTRVAFVRTVQLVNGRSTSGVCADSDVPLVPVNVSCTIVICAPASVAVITSISAMNALVGRHVMAV